MDDHDIDLGNDDTDQREIYHTGPALSQEEVDETEKQSPTANPFGGDGSEGSKGKKSPKTRGHKSILGSPTHHTSHQAVVLKSVDNESSVVTICGSGSHSKLYNLYAHYYSTYPTEALSGIMPQHVYEYVLERVNNTLESHWPCGLIGLCGCAHMQAAKNAVHQVIADANQPSFDKNAGKLYKWNLTTQNGRSCIQIDVNKRGVDS